MLIDNLQIIKKDFLNCVIQAGKELDSVRAELSRLKNPENPQYTDEEMEAMTNEATLS